MVAKDLRLQLEAVVDSQQIKEILQQLKWALEGQLPGKCFFSCSNGVKYTGC